ncbi:hypothetical protein [Streptomyces mirabilis]|uniref:hypothetical protein n=1 Tax=Streptomyces mirabilis TaxID=68239 RepID=UPI002252B61F|nr:hypothetical protein [Streptomyces mirabilis]MCX4432155.1 hypothetical protein [Streptomyces mirabilis]
MKIMLRTENAAVLLLGSTDHVPAWIELDILDSLFSRATEGNAHKTEHYSGFIPSRSTDRFRRRA